MNKLPVSLCFLLVFSGCTSLTTTSLTRVFQRDQPQDYVGEILTLWQPGEGRDTQGLPARGFAGQIFFFPPGKSSPAQITGDIAIYVFDDLGSPEEQKKPLHIYEFKEEAWKAYLTRSNIGHAYQVFIPYPRQGDHRALCSIRVKHTSVKKEATLSDPVDILLGGSNPETVLSASVDNQTITPTVIQQQPRMEVTTIPTGNKNRAQQMNTLKPHTEPANENEESSEIVSAGAEYPEWAGPNVVPASLEISSPQIKSQTKPAPPQTSNTSAHPLADDKIRAEKTLIPQESTQPLFRGQHPLKMDQLESKPEYPKTHLKVETILLENH